MSHFLVGLASAFCLVALPLCIFIPHFCFFAPHPYTHSQKTNGRGGRERKVHCTLFYSCTLQVLKNWFTFRLVALSLSLFPPTLHIASISRRLAFFGNSASWLVLPTLSIAAACRVPISVASFEHFPRLSVHHGVVIQMETGFNSYTVFFCVFPLLIFFLCRYVFSSA